MATADENIVVIESHGPTYTGIDALSEWLEGWVAAGDVVHHWTLTSLVESQDGTQAAAEWEFACTADGVRYDITGASFVMARDGKLVRVHEYRMTD